MKFGVCTSVESAALLARDGWDYVEDNVQNLLRAQESDANWNGLASTRGAALPVRAANCLVPGALKNIKYKGRISVEANDLNLPQQSARMLAFVKEQWNAA